MRSPSEPSAYVVDLTGAAGTDFTDAAMTAAAAGALRENRPVVLRFGAALPPEEAAAKAVSAVHGLSPQLAVGRPDFFRVEIDFVQEGTQVTPGSSTRFLLPHTDGGHGSYLTPSRLDVPSFDPRSRAFANSGFHTTAAHKVYQGFVVLDPGELRAATFYYDVLGMMRSAFRFRTGEPAQDVPQLAAWLGENVSYSLREQPAHGSRYLSIPAMLGERCLEFHVTPPGLRAESGFTPAQFARFPELIGLGRTCPCGTCRGPSERFFCHGLSRTTGLSWPETRARHETAFTAQANDFVIATNLFLWHGSDDSRGDRRLLPVCLVADPASNEYEQWLSEEWHRRFDASVDGSHVARG